VKVAFTVNGKRRAFSGSGMKRLLDVLREDFALTGTKEGCGEGECGACTVLLDGEAVVSCLVPVAQAAGRRVATVESLGRPARLSPLQEAFLAEGAAQCGICTPGMLMAVADLLAHAPSPGRREVEDAIAGVLYRADSSPASMHGFRQRLACFVVRGPAPCQASAPSSPRR
jgi:carbon-monoxide dehydrogenase small subunit